MGMNQTISQRVLSLTKSKTKFSLLTDKEMYKWELHVEIIF